MDRKYTYNVLEFDKILYLLSKETDTSIAKNDILKLEANTSKQYVEKQLDITQEAFNILSYTDAFIFTGRVDIYKYLTLVEKDGFLSSHEFIDILNHISVVKRLNKYAQELDVSNIPFFRSLIIKLTMLNELDEELTRCLDNEGNVKDSASFEIKKLRKNIASKENEIKNKINHIMISKKSMLSERIITIRNNRQVLAVKAEYKHVFGGLIHDESISGQTIYIEPDSCVGLNNNLIEFKSKLNNEIDKVLIYLSNFIKNRTDDIRTNLYVIKEIDIMFAKAKYSKKIDGHRVNFSSDNFVNLIGARHPLINRDLVVSNDIIFNENILIITGANTGGKTITLKTVGLFALMNQIGLFISCGPNSSLPIFDKIFTQMGDNQSLESNLSTFSSHVLDLKFIIENATSSSLVLLDEIGNGTNPSEGSALAIAILEELNSRNCKVIATTHYNELKEYATTRNYVLSSSVKFNVSKLTPTYKLKLNSTGHSYALMISERMGLPKKIITNAKQILNDNLDQNLILLEKLSEKESVFSEEKDKFNEEKKAFAKEKAELNHKISEINDSSIKIINRAKNEANTIINNAIKQSDKLIIELKSEQKHHQLLKTKKRLEAELFKEKQKKKMSDIEIIEGDEVLVLPFESKAVVVKKINDDTFEVLIGNMKSSVKKSNLIFNYRSKNKNKSEVTLNVNKKTNLKIDLRGLRVEEARLALDNYLDRVKISNLPYITIIHGYGTGAVRKMVIELLEKKNYNYRSGGANEGGSGATIVEFK
ncbi:MAG: endonuclease MutS2 [Bacilli bacterium]